MTELADYAEDVVDDGVRGASRARADRVDVGMPGGRACASCGCRRGSAPPAPRPTRCATGSSREFSVEGAFTSFGGVGYFRLSTHVYNTAADFEDFAERWSPALPIGPHAGRAS